MGLARIVWILLVCGLLSLPAQARPSGAALAECRDEYELLSALEHGIEQLNARRAVFESIYNDAFPASMSLDEALRSGENGGRQTWPETIDCPSLAEQYQSALADYQRAQSRLQRQQASWTALPESMRDTLVLVWQSRQRLLIHAQSLQQQLSPEQPAQDAVAERALLQAAVNRSLGQLSDLRRELFTILPALQRSATPARLAELLALWRGSYQLKPLDDAPRQPVLDALPPELAEAGQEYFRLARLDVLVQRNALNDVRAWLWAEQPELFARLPEASRDGLLLEEMRAFHTRLDWLFADTRASYRQGQEGDQGTPGWLKVLEYVFGLALLFLLVMLARGVRAPAAGLQAQFARWARGRNLAEPLSRVTAALPRLLPWLVGLLGIGLLHMLFTSWRLPLLTTFLPLARLYILYGLISLAGEWLLQRTAQQAGSFLNEEQLAQAQRQARIVAAVAVAPLLLQDFVALGVGPSLLLDICGWLTVLGILLALGLLLRSRREDFIEALKSFLPSRGDRLIERLLDKRLFLLIAPIAAPPLLLALLINFMHKALFAYDWYRRLFARSFRLRVAAVEGEQEAPVTEQDSVGMAAYRAWFLESDPAKVPFIDSGLYAQVRKSLDPWLGDRTQDNGLLLTGANGAGKSTIVPRLEKELAEQYPDVQVRRLLIEDKVTSSDGLLGLVSAALDCDLSAGPSALVREDAGRQPTLVVIDDAQNLFLRQVGGLAGWEALLGLVNARVENLFWLVLIDNHAWAYLGNVYGRDYQFRSIKVARRWSQNDVRSLVLSRNHLSGCRIRYDNILLATRGPEAGSIRNAEQLYFSLLWDACQGNPQLALRLWLRSIRLEGNTVVVGLPEELGGAALDALDRDLHFVYAAISIHENMSSDELVSATALPERVVRRALKTGQDMGFLERGGNRRYRIVALWYPIVTRLLARKNLLHE
tara:strand:- start:2222 stop:5032 length:2811 start_codon:yes stop_codon:yes gene_type:complete